MPTAKPALTYVARLDSAATSLVDGGGWLAVGDATMRSTDDLLTWRVS